MVFCICDHYYVHYKLPLSKNAQKTHVALEGIIITRIIVNYYAFRCMPFGLRTSPVWLATSISRQANIGYLRVEGNPFLEWSVRRGFVIMPSLPFHFSIYIYIILWTLGFLRRWYLSIHPICFRGSILSFFRGPIILSQWPMLQPLFGSLSPSTQ